MKHNTIDKPKACGCLNCTPIPAKKLPWKTEIELGFGVVILTVDKQFVDIPEHYRRRKGAKGWPFYKLLEISAIAQKAKHSKCILLEIEQALHDETYEYNHKDGRWYLVKQGLGFA